MDKLSNWNQQEDELEYLSIIKWKNNNLTKADKKGKPAKENLFNEIRESVDKYAYIYVFEVMNMRNVYLKEVRNDWSGSRIFLGRNRVMAKALGTTEESEYKLNLRELSLKLVGDVGLLFTNSTPEEVKKYFEGKKESDYARSGTIAESEIIIPQGKYQPRLYCT
ncbi:ribosomal protein L10 [Batrachochytrium dendrobatidis JEL423]|uniref:Ribosome assembly factor mrt4 n=1 Tax=Batrachochytrium dendrobatidis (strain JEL423) TaxID=403673 RepID=A0A177WMK7_BATDL|nr:ribosomal protein L10 [Batrachochytrium dendrobatidis JEL423]